MRMQQYERWNAITHGIGIVFGILILILVWWFPAAPPFASRLIYGIGFMLLFLASTLYHALSYSKAKDVLRVFDHASIFLFIAASYTPVAAYALEGRMRLLFLLFIWSVAFGGVIFKLCTIGSFDKWVRLSVLFYILLGWSGIFLARPLFLSAGMRFFILVCIGGFAYTIGTFFYKRKCRPINHVIWHIFVLVGAIVQCAAIYSL